MKRILLPAFVVAVVVTLLSARPLLSQESPTTGAPLPTKSTPDLKTVAIVSFSGMDSVLGDIEFVAQLADNPLLSLMATGGLQQVCGEELLSTIDGERPWGFVVRTDGEQFPLFGFVPTVCTQQFLAAAKSKIGQPVETDEGPLEFVIQGQPVYVELTEGWVLFSNTPEALADAPSDPTELLTGIVDSYDLGARVIVKNIPALYRTLAIGGMQMGLQPFMQQTPGEDDVQYRLRTGMAVQAMDSVKILLDELDTVEVGVAIDQESSSARIEYKVTAIEGTPTAAQLSAGKEIQTEFAGFATADSALALGVGVEITKAEVAKLLKATELLRSRAVADMEGKILSPVERNQAKMRLTGLMDVLEDLIRGRKIDGQAGVSLKPNALTLLAGLHVPDSRKLEALARNLAEEIIDSEGSDAITLDADELDDIRFHGISLPVDELSGATPELRAMVGDTLDIVLAFGDHDVYLAVGRDAIASLKQAITDSREAEDKAVPRARLSIAASSIAQVAAELGQGPAEQIAVASAIAALLEETPGMDHISITSSRVPNGQAMKIEIEQGLLKVLGSLSKLK